MTSIDRDSLKTTARTWQDILGVTVLSPDPSVSATMRECLADLWSAIEALAGGPQSSQDPQPGTAAALGAAVRPLRILAR